MRSKLCEISKKKKIMEKEDRFVVARGRGLRCEMEEDGRKEQTFSYEMRPWDIMHRIVTIVNTVLCI